MSVIDLCLVIAAPIERCFDLSRSVDLHLESMRHHFSTVEGGTLVRDHVHFASPLGPFGHLADRLVITSYLRRLLERRAEIIRRAAESPAAAD